MDVKPRNRAYNINKTRAANLRNWLQNSGVMDFASMIRPVEIDLGVWDPRVHAGDDQALVMRLIEGSTLALTLLLRILTNCNLVTAAECTLVFRLSLQLSTAMGPICVPNDRKQALVVVKEMCESRLAVTQAKFRGGFFTRHGYSVITNDINSCRAVADLLVGYIAEEKEEESDDSDGSGGAKSNSKSPVGKKGKRSGN